MNGSEMFTTCRVFAVAPNLFGLACACCGGDVISTRASGCQFVLTVNDHILAGLQSASTIVKFPSVCPTLIGRISAVLSGLIT